MWTEKIAVLLLDTRNQFLVCGRRPLLHYGQVQVLWRFAHRAVTARRLPGKDDALQLWLDDVPEKLQTEGGFPSLRGAQHRDVLSGTIVLAKLTQEFLAWHHFDGVYASRVDGIS